MIQKSEIDKFFFKAGEMRTFRAKKYFKEGRVHIKDICEDGEGILSISADVNGTSNYDVEINVADGKIAYHYCDCFDDSIICKHVLATLLEIEKNYNHIEDIIPAKFKYKEFSQLINYFAKKDETGINLYKEVKIIPVISTGNYGNWSVSFKIGKGQMYKLKNLTEFYEAVKKNENFKYGQKLEFRHIRDAFTEDSLPLLDFILKYAEMIRYSNDNIGYSSYGKLSNSMIYLDLKALDEFFDISNGKTIDADYSEEILFFDAINSNKFEIENVNENECKLINIAPSGRFLEGDKYIYIFTGEEIIRYAEKDKNIIDVLKIFKENYTNEIIFEKKELPDLFTLVLPKIKEFLSLEKLNSEDIEKYMPKELGVKLLLDTNQLGDIIGEIKFCYGEDEFNPLNVEAAGIARNKPREDEVIELLDKMGFKTNYEEKNMILSDEEKIYEFLTLNINECMEKFEVLVTEELKSKQIKPPKIGSIGVRIENNLLTLNFSELDFDISEIKEIMQKYRLKKKYHRLRNGNFISLEENQDIKFLDSIVDGTDIELKSIAQGEVKLPIHRSLYLNKLLENAKGTKINKDDNFKRIVKEINLQEIQNEAVVPKSLDGILRDYQKTGYKWLSVLDTYNFGGILADDMGLGKTLQVISLLLNYKENGGKRAAIVVCPSSLSRNWDNEIKKFADSINTLVISGKAAERKCLILDYENYDLLITSYDLLKRDIDVYNEIKAEFSFIIADEAQYIKNGNTQNAKALKMLNSRTRYALTGTPIENSLAELWSIFDYVMPGYLFNYNKFKKNYELPIVRDNDSYAMDRLRMMIEPFVLRRHKKDVLTELPDKTVTVLYNDMEEPQKKIYLSYFAQTQREIMSEIESKGFEKSKLVILALLTRLRQICCHPSLFIDNYIGGSGKLIQCMEIIEQAVSGGHKILLFSSYTSMFDIIEAEFKKSSIAYFKLTGQTRVDERIKLVDAFNKNNDINVFLISLKAGGTGLNLTGADMVIHYDPWWNIAAENQATDRAYRIGQKNNVQVYKLITKDSIEEKINELQEKKSRLIDDVLSTEEKFINKLSKDDILELFK